MFDTFSQSIQIWPSLVHIARSGPFLSGWLLLLGLAIAFQLKRSPRSAIWLGVIGYLSACFLRTFLVSPSQNAWWIAALVGSAWLLWTLLTPLFLRFEKAMLTGFFWVIGLGVALDLAPVLASGLQAALGFSKTDHNLLFLFSLLAFVIPIMHMGLPQRPWFRMLSLALLATHMLLGGFAGLFKMPYASLHQAPSLFLTVLAAVLLDGFLIQRSISSEEPDILARYEPLSGAFATHLFLILFTIATLYPVLWVFKMATTPIQGFSMGLNPVPETLVNAMRSWQRGEHDVSRCYRRAMAQNFREVMGVGSACHDQVCQSYRVSKKKSALQHKNLCPAFHLAWKKPKKARTTALQTWKLAALKRAPPAQKAGLGRLLSEIVHQQKERDERASLFWKQLLNSLFVALTTTILGVFLACTAAYAFSRFRFPGQHTGLMSFLVSQMFPGTLMMIPLYILVSRLGLLNHLFGLTLVYSTTSIPFCVWMLKGYFDTIPKELEEAALIDGASRTLIFWKIMLPLARPAIAVTALFSFMTAWNEFILAATFMNEETSYTLPVMLQRFVGAHNTEWGHFAAGAIIVSLPIVFLFFLLQKNLVSGLTAGSVKG